MKRTNPTWVILAATPELLNLLRKVDLLTPAPLVFTRGDKHSVHFFITGCETEPAFKFQREEAGLKRTYTFRGFSQEYLPEGKVSYHPAILKFHTKTVDGNTEFYFPVEEQSDNKKGVLYGTLGELSELPAIVAGDDLEGVPMGV
jgi:hypothetical protein